MENQKSRIELLADFENFFKNIKYFIHETYG